MTCRADHIGVEADGIVVRRFKASRLADRETPKARYAVMQAAVRRQNAGGSDPDAYNTGVCVLHGDAFAKLWAVCRERGLTVVADVHTHGAAAAAQSHSDRTNPMVARAGHIAIIVPNMATPPTQHATLGIYEYCGEHEWTNRSGKNAKCYFYVGLWS